ncbi:MAG: MFS transporter [Acidobacteriaceae bacterium]
MTKRTQSAPPRIYYGWWIVLAAFLNLFFSVGIIYYGFPVFYPAFVTSLGFTRTEVTQGFLIGAFVVGIPFGLLAGALIDRVGARWVILSGVGFVGIPLVLMGFMTRFWQYEVLCIVENLGYTLAGPIANQVLVAQWFRVRRGQAMGYAYLGLGLGGVVAPPLSDFLIRTFGWRSALEITGAFMLTVLFPVGYWVTRSTPAELGLLPDGFDTDCPSPLESDQPRSIGVVRAVRSANFWLIMAGTMFVLGTSNVVIQHFILFLEDKRYSSTTAAQFLSALLISSLGGRVLVGYIADRFRKKNTMALFYLLMGTAMPLLYLASQPTAVWVFAALFGFALGADYMLIPLVLAECFGVENLGMLLSLIVAGFSISQWGASWMAGKAFEIYHSYELVWKVLTIACALGAAAIYAVSTQSGNTPSGAEEMLCSTSGIQGKELH